MAAAWPQRRSRGTAAACGGKAKGVGRSKDDCTQREVGEEEPFSSAVRKTYEKPRLMIWTRREKSFLPTCVSLCVEEVALFSSMEAAEAANLSSSEEAISNAFFPLLLRPG